MKRTVPTTNEFVAILENDSYMIELAKVKPNSPAITRVTNMIKELKKRDDYTA